MESNILTFLSIQHCKPQTDPVAYDNEQRARAFREVQPVETHNNYNWKHLEGEKAA